MTDTTAAPKRTASPTVKKLKLVSNGLLVLTLPVVLVAFLAPSVVAPIIPIIVFVSAWVVTGWSMALRFIARTPAQRRTWKNVALSGREVAVLPVLFAGLSLILSSGHPEMWTYTLISLTPVLTYLFVVILGIVSKWPSPNQVIMDEPAEIVSEPEASDTEPESAETTEGTATSA